VFELLKRIAMKVRGYIFHSYSLLQHIFLINPQVHITYCYTHIIHKGMSQKSDIERRRKRNFMLIGDICVFSYIFRFWNFGIPHQYTIILVKNIVDWSSGIE